MPGIIVLHNHNQELAAEYYQTSSQRQKIMENVWDYFLESCYGSEVDASSSDGSADSFIEIINSCANESGVGPFVEDLPNDITSVGF